jgi:hypothetical protein
MVIEIDLFLLARSGAGALQLILNKLLSDVVVAVVYTQLKQK